MSIETLSILKLISDAGLLVLIWLVQLVIYPSFRFYNLENLKKWHSIYKGKITLVVLPLMLSQLVLSCWLTIKYNWDIFHTINAVLVILTWISTFITFVPIHEKIDKKNDDLSTNIQKLIGYNWFRTFLWSVIFLMTLWHMLS